MPTAPTDVFTLVAAFHIDGPALRTQSIPERFSEGIPGFRATVTETVTVAVEDSTARKLTC